MVRLSVGAVIETWNNAPDGTVPGLFSTKPPVAISDISISSAEYGNSSNGISGTHENTPVSCVSTKNGFGHSMDI